jgi:hypothetical protein
MILIKGGFDLIDEKKIPAIQAEIRERTEKK